jgi:hypothetical protein
MINRLFNDFEGKLTLVKCGVLVKEPGGGRSTSYALATP